MAQRKVNDPVTLAAKNISLFRTRHSISAKIGGKFLAYMYMYVNCSIQKLLMRWKYENSAYIRSCLHLKLNCTTNTVCLLCLFDIQCKASVLISLGEPYFATFWDNADQYAEANFCISLKLLDFNLFIFAKGKKVDSVQHEEKNGN